MERLEGEGGVGGSREAGVFFSLSSGAAAERGSFSLVFFLRAERRSFLSSFLRAERQRNEEAFSCLSGEKTPNSKFFGLARRRRRRFRRCRLCTYFASTSLTMLFLSFLLLLRGTTTREASANATLAQQREQQQAAALALVALLVTFFLLPHAAKKKKTFSSPLPHQHRHRPLHHPPHPAPHKQAPPLRGDLLVRPRRRDGGPLHGPVLLGRRRRRQRQPARRRPPPSLWRRLPFSLIQPGRVRGPSDLRRRRGRGIRALSRSSRQRRGGRGRRPRRGGILLGPFPGAPPRRRGRRRLRRPQPLRRARPRGQPHRDQEPAQRDHQGGPEPAGGDGRHLLCGNGQAAAARQRRQHCCSGRRFFLCCCRCSRQHFFAGGPRRAV